MRKFIALLFLIFVFTTIDTKAQSVGISNQKIIPHQSAALEIRTNSKGLLIPRMIKTERDAIASPATGLLIFQTDNDPGFYYFNGMAWTSIGASGRDSDNDPTNEIQSIRISHDTIYLSDGGFVKLPAANNNHDFQNLSLSGNTLSLTNDATAVDLSPYLDNTDNQVLQLSGNNLSLTNGGSVNLGTISTDNQNLTLTDNILSLTNDPTPVDLSKYLNNIPSLTFTNPMLEIAGGNSVNLNALQDNMGNHMATQNIRTNGFWLSNDGTDHGIMIDANNHIAIGANVAKAPLYVSSNDDIQVYIENTSLRPTTIMYLQMSQIASPDRGQGFVTFANSRGSTIGIIEGNSRGPGPGGVNYTTTSDRRLKDNIVNTHYALSDLMKIQVCDYNMINSSDTQTGFIAQDLFAIYPMAVSVGGDDPNKKPWSIDYGKLTPLITKAVQELTINVENLKKENLTLQSENEQLKEKLNTVEDHEKRITELEAQMQTLLNSISEGQKNLK